MYGTIRQAVGCAAALVAHTKCTAKRERERAPLAQSEVKVKHITQMRVINDLQLKQCESQKGREGMKRGGLTPYRYRCCSSRRNRKSCGDCP